MKKAPKQWMAILAVLAGMAWCATAAPLHPPVAVQKNIISGG